MRGKELGLLSLVGFCCVACGGGGGSSTNVPGNYAGTYIGQFVDIDGKTGSVVLQVQTGNPEAVSGQIMYPSGTLAIKGDIINRGGGTMYVGNTSWAAFNFGPAGSNTVAMSIGQGLLNIDLPNGNGSSSQPAQYANPAKVALIANPTGLFGSGSNFQGEFSGTITDTTLNQNSAIAISIDNNGKIGGPAVIQKEGAPVIETITGAIQSKGQLAYTISGNNISGQGTLTLSQGTLCGTVKLNNGDSATVSLTAAKPIPPPSTSR